MRSRLSLSRIFSSLALAVATFAVAPAHAQETASATVTSATPPEFTRATYPMSLLERPLLLPKLVFQPTVDIGIVNYKTGTGETLGLGLDVGLSKRLQAGFFFELPVGPYGGDLGVFVANLQTSLNRYANLRFDVGMQRASIHADGFNGEHQDSFVMGVGAPIKIKLHKLLAFVSGSAAAHGFGAQPVLADDRTKSQMYLQGTAFSNDILTLGVIPGGVTFPDTTVSGSLFLPVGLLLQPHERFSVGVRTGYRMSFTHTGGVDRDNLTHFIPLAVDLVVSPIRQLDVGFTAQFQGYVGSNMDLGNNAQAPGWADVRQFNVWVGGRI